MPWSEIAWYATLISSKTYRAVLSAMELDDQKPVGGVELEEADWTDVRGSAKCARLFIASSIRAWRVLMEVGRATADGVPARLVQVLTDLDDGLAARFPDAMRFVRPGLDEGPNAAETPAAPQPGAHWLAQVKVEQ